MPRRAPSSRSTGPAAAPAPAEPRFRWLVLCAGWLLPQLILIGPALFGWTVVLPLDLLALERFYLPQTPEYQHVVPSNFVLSDLVVVGPMARQFCSREFRAGRLPVWQNANYAGAPFATWPKYSLFELPYYLAPRSVTLAWMQLFQMLVLGIGTWLLLRRGLRLSFWPAAIGGWCTPLIGFVSLWQGFPVVGPVCWLPWLVYLAGNAVENPWGPAAWSLALVTALVLLCGQSDVAALVLLTTGLYALGRIATARADQRRWSRAISAAAGLCAAWTIGFLLAAPYLLPMIEFTRSGARMQRRAVGAEERPPQGWQALPAIVVPEIYGSSRRGSQMLVSVPPPESSATAYAGLLATLWLAPLAWCDRGRRGEVVFWTGLAVVALGWVLGLPPIVQLERLRGLNMLSYNRWTFATATALVVLAAIGLERLFAAPVRFRLAFLLPISLAALVCGWCLLAAISLPQSWRSRIRLDHLAEVESNLSWYYLGAALVAALALAAWYATFTRAVRRRWAPPVIATLLVAELTVFAGRQYRQAPPELYFPRIPALEKLAGLAPGRIWGLGCLPPNLNQSHGLCDVRGYDAVDAADYVRLFELACDPAVKSPTYAMTQYAVPPANWETGAPRLLPVANLLNARYLVTRYPPPDGTAPLLHSDDYWIVENPAALARVTVPRSVRRVTDPAAALAALGDPGFDPAAVTLVADALELPPVIDGDAAIRSELPARIEIEARMRTDGLVRIADLWDPGWQAEVDGQAATVYKADYALRGVRVPQGTHTLVLTYTPSSLAGGVRLACVGAGAWGLWGVLLAYRRLVRAGRCRGPART